MSDKTGLRQLQRERRRRRRRRWRGIPLSSGLITRSVCRGPPPVRRRREAARARESRAVGVVCRGATAVPSRETPRAGTAAPAHVSPPPARHSTHTRATYTATVTVTVVVTVVAAVAVAAVVAF